MTPIFASAVSSAWTNVSRSAASRVARGLNSTTCAITRRRPDGASEAGYPALPTLVCGLARMEVCRPTIGAHRHRLAWARADDRTCRSESIPSRVARRGPPVSAYRGDHPRASADIHDPLAAHRVCHRKAGARDPRLVSRPMAGARDRRLVSRPTDDARDRPLASSPMVCGHDLPQASRPTAVCRDHRAVCDRPAVSIPTRRDRRQVCRSRGACRRAVCRSTIAAHPRRVTENSSRRAIRVGRRGDRPTDPSAAIPRAGRRSIHLAVPARARLHHAGAALPHRAPPVLAAAIAARPRAGAMVFRGDLPPAIGWVARARGTA